MEHSEPYSSDYQSRRLLNQNQISIEEGILEAIEAGRMTKELGEQCLNAYYFGLNSRSHHEHREAS